MGKYISNTKDTIIINLGVINNEELVELFGSPKNRIKFYKDRKVPKSMKDSIFKTASLYCDIYDLGKGKYEIRKVYNNFIFPNLKKMKSNMYKYIIPLILLKLLEIHNDETKLENTVLSWAMLIRMITWNYKIIKKHKIKVSNHYNFNIDIVSEYFDVVDNLIKKNIKDSLQLLSDAEILCFEKIKMVCKFKMDYVGKKTNVSTYSYCEVATEEEIQFDKDISGKLKKRLCIENDKQCYFGKNAMQYQRLLKQSYRDANIMFFYESYNITNIDIEKCNALLLNFKYDDLNTLITNLNNNLIDKIITNANKRYEQAILEDSEKLYRQTKDYVELYKKLSDWTINSKCAFNIKDEIDFSNEADEDLVDILESYNFKTPSGKSFKLIETKEGD